MRIYLTGFMGAGKTTVGQHLARHLNWAFVDLDELVETNAEKSVDEIFKSSGEARFRVLERQALRQTLDFPRVVVATGGGTVTIDKNLELIRSAGLNLWLNPTLDTIVSRIGRKGKDKRPLYPGEAQARRLFFERLPAYQHCDIKVDVAEDEQPQEVAARIALLLRERKCVT